MLKKVLSERVLGNFIEPRKPLAGAKKLCVADLFAGAGGLSLAAMNVGLRVLFAVEKDPHAAASFRNNLVDDLGPLLFQEDLNEISPEDVASRIDDIDNGLDLLMGGPPCQGYSVHRIKDAGVNDPRNELIHKYFRFVDFFRPKIFLMENVPGILWPRHASYLDEFYKTAEQCGYRVHLPAVFEAADFGVPQKRKRVFVLGVRNDLKIQFDWPIDGDHVRDDVGGEEKAVWRTAKMVFSAPLPKNDPNSIHMNHGKELIDVFKGTPKNGGSRADSNRILPCHKKHDGHKDVYGRIDPRKPGPTMTTACINPSKGRFVHPTKHHGITVRHAARFQTFPDEFVFEGGLISSGVQIGNAVPILLGEKIIKEIAFALLRRA